MADVLIALGGNVGDVRTTLVRAIDLIVARAPGRVVARSSDYETPPWGDVKQSPFVNACIRLATPTAPQVLLPILHEIENEFGRDRSVERRWGPRPLDLDLLAWDDVAIDSPELMLPHPRLFERAFVLAPLAEIAPDWRDPVSGKSVEELLRVISE